MSQSTNLEYLKTGENLINFNQYSGPLSNSEYVRFKSYQLGNTITNSIPTLNELVPPNKIDIFNINRSPSNCPTYDCTSILVSNMNPHALTIPVIVPPNLSVPTGVLTDVTQYLTENEKEEQRHPNNEPKIDICKYSLNMLRKKDVWKNVC